MGKSYLELKIVSDNLQNLNELIKQYEKLGFIDDGFWQDNGEVYWTFMKINLGLINESDALNTIRMEDGSLEPAQALGYCCEFGEARNNGSCDSTDVKDYVRNANDCDGSSWDSDPICLCDEHGKGHELYNNKIDKDGE